MVLGCGERVPGVRRVAVLRANALGDYLVAVPALAALRAAYPDAEVVLLGTPLHAELLAGRPGPVDRVAVVPSAPGVREPGGDGEADRSALEEFFAAMVAERFDLAVQLHGGGRWSNPFLRRLGARLTVGLRTPDAAPLDRWVPYVYYQHEVLRFLEVVALVGAAPVGLEPRLAVTEADRAAATAALTVALTSALTAASAGAGVGGAGRPLVALHPGATDPRRRWPVDRFAAVGDALADAGANVLVTGGAGERDLVDGVRSRMRRPAAGLAGALSLSALAGVLERCAVVVANDTGPRHLAAAVGAATVSVYWCGNLVNAGPLTRTRHRPHVSWRTRCPVCGVAATEPDEPPREPAGCEHTDSFVADVPVGPVRDDALDLLGSGVAAVA